MSKVFRPGEHQFVMIDLNERWADCWACDGPALGYGLPIDARGDLVAPDDEETEWAGQPACPRCYHAHEQGLLTADNQHQWRRKIALERKALDALIVRQG